MRFSKYFDHTNLKADATLADITRLCYEAMRYQFMSVCVNPFYVPVAARLLQKSDVKVCTVVGFPLGQTTPQQKAREAKEAVLSGADEIDMVQNIAMVHAGEYKFIEGEILKVKQALEDVSPNRHIVLKVILETCYLERKEIIQSALTAKRAGADFVKTSTGFGKWGAKAKDVLLMRNTVGDSMGVKASGGIHTLEEAYRMIDSGANRLGCSASVDIMEELLSARR